ncbi:hypothetical protein GCM10011608_60920 [Micromonospora sonchi]|uniref:Uncharacterized protein n=1 Tax=Micromonospora sonchi TaxID=1763543 RepID=A0A917UB28_9ACTN|nr:hypothetical protein GCM10011608_60920 [Micromonospora sonchi]
MHLQPYLPLPSDLYADSTAPGRRTAAPGVVSAGRAYWALVYRQPFAALRSPDPPDPAEAHKTSP